MDSQEVIKFNMDTKECFNGDKDRLDWLDYFIFALTLIIALGIGIYHSFAQGGQKTTDDYLMGKRQLKPIPVAFSIFMSVMSGITVIGLSGEMYIYGTQMWMDSVAKSIFYAISAYLYVPMMYRLKVVSVYQFHLLRFNSIVLQKCCITFGIIVGLIYMGLAMYAPATAIEAVTGFPLWASLVLTGIVVIIYTTIGGIKAVVWTDFFQGFILFGGLLIVLIIGCVRVGGLNKVWEISQKGGRINFFDMNPDPTERITFWTVMLGAGILALSQSATEQTQVQRYCALPTLNQAIFVVLMQIPLLLLVYVLVCLCGLTAYAYYEMTGCDPYRGKLVSNTNQLLPYFIVDAIGVKGLTGLFIAVIYSGALSSISSSMNALAAVTWNDILQGCIKNMDEYRKTTLTKITSMVYGIIGVGLGFGMQYLRSNVMQLATALLGGLSAPVAGVVISGSLIPWIQAKGMLIGLFSGLFMFLWINIGQMIYYPHSTYLNTTVTNCTFPSNETERVIPDDPEDVFWLYNLSFQYIPLASLLTTILVASVASLLTGKQDPKQLDPKVMVNLGNKCCCCWSPSCQNNCTFGIPFGEISEDKAGGIVYGKDMTNGLMTNSIKCDGQMDVGYDQHNFSFDSDQTIDTKL